MKISPLHDWNVAPAEAARIQAALRERCRLEDAPDAPPFRTVGGADISYDKGSDRFFAAVLVFTFPGLERMAAVAAEGRATFPYIPGFLSFREGPILLEAFSRLSRLPDVVLFDGQGIAHPRGLGLAAHLGLFLDHPSIGCAKTRLVGAFAPVGDAAGSQSILEHRGQTIGMVLRTKARTRPLFISPGHRISLERSVATTLACCRGYRLPEPTRQAHLAVNRLRLGLPL